MVRILKLTSAVAAAATMIIAIILLGMINVDMLFRPYLYSESLKLAGYITIGLILVGLPMYIYCIYLILLLVKEDIQLMIQTKRSNPVKRKGSTTSK